MKDEDKIFDVEKQIEKAGLVLDTLGRVIIENKDLLKNLGGGVNLSELDKLANDDTGGPNFLGVCNSNC